MSNTLKLGIVMAFLALLVLGCTAQQQLPSNPEQTTQDTAAAVKTQGERVQVLMEDFAFGPVNQEISIGDTVEWVNTDSVAHTVTFENGAFDEQLPVGGTAEYTFTQEGVYRYVCAFHPEMQGTIVVS